MSRVLLISILILILSAPLASADVVSHSWSKSFGEALNDYAYATATDGLGNVYLLGEFQIGIDFGGDSLSSAGVGDVCLVKFAPDGSHLWSQRFGGTSIERTGGLDVDPYGFVSVTGYFLNSTDFGGGSLASAGGNDMVVARYAPDGSHLWSDRIGSAGEDIATGVAIGDLGSTYVVGYFNGTLTLGSDVHVSAGGVDILLAKYDKDGNLLWSDSFGSIDDDWGQDVVVDADGNATLIAYGNGSIDFGGGLLSSLGLVDIYIAQFDESGTHRWSRVCGGNSLDYANSLAIDSGNNVLLAGYVIGTVDFGGGPMVTSGWDAVVAKYDQSGAHLWSDVKGNASVEKGFGVTTDDADNVYIVGTFNVSDANLGGGTLPLAGSTDMFIACYDRDGAHKWSRGFGSFGADQARGVATDWFGNVIMAGYFDTAVYFGGGALISNGGHDIALARLCQGPRIHSVLDVPGDQGGLVNVAWDRNSLDNTIELGIINYSLWRAIDAAAAAALVEDGAALIDEPAKLRSVAADQAIVRAAGNYYWYKEVTVSANQLKNYSAPVATLFDSTGATPQHHYFQVIAHTANPSVFYPSDPDSGYSVDDLAPAAPQNLIAAQQVAPEGLELTWDANTEEDLAHYEVYRGTHAGFVADGGSFLSESPDTMAFDGNWGWDGGYWYKVFAVDTHGNKSPYALIGPDLVSDVGGDAPAVNRLKQNVPNPFNPTTTIAFTLADAHDVTLRIYNATGQLVRVLVDGHRGADHHAVTWDGRDDKGQAAASGVYFYRLTAGAFMQTKKMVLLK